MDIEKLAAQARAQLKAENKTPESKDADADSSSETKKTKALDEQELTDSEDAESDQDDQKEKPKSDEKKSDEEKPKAETPKDKPKSNVQKRIDELTAEKTALEEEKATTKAEKEAVQEQMLEIKAELDALKRQLTATPAEKTKEVVKSELQKRIQKYVEEDKSLPREDRREMSKEEYEEWLNEDFEAADEWKARRTIRRVREEDQIKTDIRTQAQQKTAMEKFNRGYEKAIIKHPELNTTKRRLELEAQGKSKAEIRAIFDKENPKFNLFVKIFEKEPDVYQGSDDVVAAIVTEMEKRMDKSSKAGDDKTEVEELKKQLAAKDAEIESLKNLDVGITSTRGAEPKEASSELDEKRNKLALKVGLDPKKLKARVQERIKQGYDG